VTISGPPTLDDVAQAAGVSRSTASRAINGGLRVSPEAQAAVDDAVARLGYAPNRAARSLVTRRTDSIALVVPEPDQRILTDPFLSGTLAGVSEGLAGPSSVSRWSPRWCDATMTPSTWPLRR
jgi:DNA-binding LacI/PurR family transcriptional regulator